MWTHLLSALLSAAPVVVQPWGLSLEVKEDAIFVAAVEAGGPAELAQVKPGAQLVRILEPLPTRRLAIGSLGGESFTDAIATLREGTSPQLVLEFGRGGSREQKVLARTPFKSKTGAQMQALSPLQLSEYIYELHRQQMGRHAALRPGVRLEFDRVDPLAIVDPKKHALTGVLVGGATGEWVWVEGQLAYTCPSTPAVSVRIAGAGPAAAVVVDLTSSHLSGGTRRVLLPAARLAEVEKCPSAPLVRELDLQLECEGGGTVAGREKLRLGVDCSDAKRQDWAPSPFTQLEPAVFETRVGEGTATFTVGPYFGQGGPLPTSVTILVNDKAGKAAVTVPNAWLPDRSTGSEALPEAKVPVPKAAGAYAVVYEASWADGSKSRSSPSALTVLSAADEAKETADFREGSNAMFAVTERMKAAGINACDRKVAIAWLRKQPEVEWVTENDASDYSYEVKKAPSPMLVHCH